MKRWVKLSEYAKLIGYRYITVWKKYKEGKITPTRKEGNRVLVMIDEDEMFPLSSKNIARRSSDSLKLTKKQALTEGLNIFLKNHKVKRLETNVFSIRARSCTRTAIVNNPYLESYFASSNLCEVI